MYSLRTARTVDCVDLDPYGTASPFIDGAVQCVNDGGASPRCLRASLTFSRSALRDMHRHGRTRDKQLSREMVCWQSLTALRLTHNSFANYGGIPAKAEYCHEGVRSSLTQSCAELNLARLYDCSCMRSRRRLPDTDAASRRYSAYPLISTCGSSCAYTPARSKSRRRSGMHASLAPEPD